MSIRFCCALALLVLIVSCGHGFEPPEPEPGGQIRGTVRYTGTWPPPSDIRDLRFVAMRFVPQDTLDFLQLNRMAISDRLVYGVTDDEFVITDVVPGTFVYSGIAVQATEDILSWRPIGLLDGDGGLFVVTSGEETRLEVAVDFGAPPPFPPEVN